MENTDATGQPAALLLHVNQILPFENIALAFSGGGFRAASFALGVLSYLNNTKFSDPADPLNGTSLLHQVTFISSASGGTITAALYALYNSGGKTFAEFYVKLFETLQGEQILKNALEILSDKARWRNRPKKSRNIINAFAMAYDEYIFEGSTLKALGKISVGSHLQEVCFNTTEFYTGLSFRQDKKLVYDSKPDKYFKFGNHIIFLDEAVADELKLSDLLAASSCFPAGFEPIIFPNDFTHQGLTEDTLKKALTMQPQTGDKQEREFIRKKRVGFMDGGITDNQGLQSMMDADRRRIERETDYKPFNLMLVNDVGSHFIKPYVMPAAPHKGGLSLSAVNLIVIACFIAAVGITVAGVCLHCTALTIVGSILVPLPLVFMGIVLWVRKKVFNVTASGTPSGILKSFTERIVLLLVKYFTKTPLPVLKQMLLARADSVMLLNMSVFLKRIRQLLYNTFYGSPEWKNRGKGNHIYDLSFSNNINRTRNPVPPPMEPSRDLQIVAQVAFNMGTTLWFDKTDCLQEHDEACIIACGQFTTCYNLLEYIDRLLKDPSAFAPAYLNRLVTLKQQLTDDYARFKADPFFMYNDAGREYKITNFTALSVKDIPFPTNWA
ncbi:MAG: patatin-like phospholipase family protein [Bacteroidota bacterium]|nr:patatin-like phospholipase family protein [Bacteroidota bacterium]